MPNQSDYLGLPLSARGRGGPPLERDTYGRELPGLTPEEDEQRVNSAKDEANVSKFWYNNPNLSVPTKPTSYFGRRPQLSKQLKAMIRKGIPFELRPKVCRHDKCGLFMKKER